MKFIYCNHSHERISYKLKHLISFPPRSILHCFSLTYTSAQQLRNCEMARSVIELHSDSDFPSIQVRSPCVHLCVCACVFCFPPFILFFHYRLWQTVDKILPVMDSGPVVELLVDYLYYVLNHRLRNVLSTKYFRKASRLLFFLNLCTF